MESPPDDPRTTDPTSSSASGAGTPPAHGAEASHFTLVDANGTALLAPTRNDIEQRLSGDAYFWLDLHQPTADDIAMLGGIFAFHPLSLEDAAHFGQRPKIDPYDGYAYLVVYGAAPDEDGLVEVHCFSAERYLVTVRHDDCPAFSSLQKRYMARPDSLSDETMLALPRRGRADGQLLSIPVGAR